MATGCHHGLGQSLMMMRRQVGLWPLRGVVWADKPLPCACIRGHRESSLLAQCPQKRDDNIPEHVGEVQAQEWSQFFVEANISEKVSGQFSPSLSLKGTFTVTLCSVRKGCDMQPCCVSQYILIAGV